MVSTKQNEDGPEVRIRPYPYPYQAAFAFCNDLDCIASFAEMKAIHDVLNGRKMTPCGPGLGLEVGDSFHFYSVHPQRDDTFSYFKGTTKTPSEDAPAIREGIAAGLLDTLHTWGNFSQKGGFFRRHAKQALRELERYNLQVPVWTNHGDIHNFQNLGRPDSLGDLPETSSVRGDVSEVLEYHLDLTRKAGVRYIWVKELTRVIGQERPLDPSDWIESGVHIGKNLIRGFLQKAGGSRPGNPQQVGNRLLEPFTLRDGSVLYQLLRYGSFAKDGGDHLPELITTKTLRRLVETGGAMLFYTHLAKGRPSPDKPFSKESYRALERLAQWFHDGDIWVTTPARLCRYIELRRRLRFDREREGEEERLICRFEPLGELPPPSLEGLTITVRGAVVPRLFRDGEEIALVKNPPDRRGLISYSVHLDPLEYPWE